MSDVDVEVYYRSPSTQLELRREGMAYVIEKGDRKVTLSEPGPAASYRRSAMRALEGETGGLVLTTWRGAKITLRHESDLEALCDSIVVWFNTYSGGEGDGDAQEEER